MTTSSTRYQGFTLIEILIVVAIIGIVVAAIVLSLTSRQNRSIDQLAAQLTNQLQLASQEAMLKSTQYGFSTTPGRTQSYQFYQLREDTLVWEPVTNRVAFKPSVLPEDYELRFIKMPDETFSPLPVQNQSSIAIEFHANGDITPFILEIRDDQKRLYQISGDRSGNIELLLPR